LHGAITSPVTPRSATGSCAPKAPSNGYEHSGQPGGGEQPGPDSQELSVAEAGAYRGRSRLRRRSCARGKPVARIRTMKAEIDENLAVEIADDPRAGSRRGDGRRSGLGWRRRQAIDGSGRPEFFGEPLHTARHHIQDLCWPQGTSWLPARAPCFERISCPLLRATCGSTLSVY
jgi:hypothetical protein